MPEVTRDTAEIKRELDDVRRKLVQLRRALGQTEKKWRTLGRATRGVGKDFRESVKATKAHTTAIRKNTQAAEKNVRKTGKVSKELRNLGSSAIFAVGPLSGVGARIAALGAVSARSGIKIALFAVAIVGLGVAVFKLISGAIKANIALRKILGVLETVSGSAIVAQLEFERLADFSLKLGLDLEAAATQAAQFAAAAKGSALEGQGQRDVFEAMSIASVALRLSTEQTTGAFRAMQQMMSKGTVQAEELRGQLGERLPGAINLAAKAMGVTTRELGKMLERGEVLAEDLLPKMAVLLKEAFSKEAFKAAQELAASTNRLTTAVFLFNAELDRAAEFSGLATVAVQKLTAVILLLKRNIGAVLGVLGGIAAGFAALGAAFIIGRIKRLAGAVVLATKALGSMSTALGGLGLLLRVTFVIGSAIAAFVALKDSIGGSAEATKALVDEMERLIEVQKLLGTVSSDTARIMAEEARTRIEVLQTEIATLDERLKLALRVPQAEIFLGKGLGTTKLPRVGIEAMRAALFAANEELVMLKESLDRFNATPFGEDGTADVDAFSKAFERAAVKVDKLIAKLGDLRAAREMLEAGRLGTAAFMESLTKARETLRKVTDPGERAALLEKLGGVGGLPNEAFISKTVDALKSYGIVVDAVTVKLAFLLDESKKLDEGNKDLAKRIAATEGVLLKFDATLEELRTKTAGLRAGKEISDAFEEIAKGEKIFDRLRVSLDKAKLSEEERTAKLKEARTAVDQLVRAQLDYNAALKLSKEAVKQLKRELKFLEDVVESSFAVITDAITEAFEAGSIAALNFRDIARGVVLEIHKAFIQLALVNPLKNLVFGGMEGFVPGPTIGGVAGRLSGFLGGLLGGGAGAPLNLSAGVTPVFRRHGGSLAAGQAAVVGEAGPEHFIPRTSGVVQPRATGGDITVIQNITTPDADSFGLSRSQIAAEAFRDASRESRRID